MKKIVTFIFIVSFSILGFSQETEERYTIQNLSVNNRYSNFGTSLYGENQMIFAMPAKRNYIINNTWTTNNQPFLDLYVGDIKESGQLENIKKFSSKLNTRFHEADVTFTKDKKTVYFTRSNYFKGKYKKDTLGINRLKMFKATVGENDEWLNIESMPFNDDNYSCGHPSLSEDQSTLYFVSDMPGTLGKTDIFKVAVNGDGTYGPPVNLGPTINTEEREMFPYIDGNDELYYSTNGRDDGLGMLDIYVARFTPDGILEPVHLGNNINSERDDFAFIINKEKREGYFSSNRYRGKGDDDIYYFKEEIPLPKPVIVCKQIFNIIVKNRKTGELISNADINISKGSEAIIEGDFTDEKGAYKLEDVDCETEYTIEAGKRFFLSDTKLIKTSNKNELEQTIEMLISPDEFIVVREKVMIDINPIYFDYDKFNIRKDAARELDKVVKVMNKYPDLIVESGSHTDSRGRDAYNNYLSDKRALSTVDYIISKGISPERITGKGYGETQLTNKCSNGVRCTTEEHQLNRRTEFVIVNPEVIN
ncbi:Outer membrane protein OmpA [Lutibacter oricola]|uniref:Outer membrane protein OmpA n=1 Tax=Lutibacter oricola TaxID=762486 RepID=A0A1H3C1D6_9FLAO|nr:OmpA family protein [Lutibacter oricola]SDX47454.1 Outer membrane protein OmpA [Lutibacter oricola]